MGREGRGGVGCKMVRPQAISRSKSDDQAVSPTRRRLIVNADDFGRSAEINEAVIRAHRDGVLTSASLMVNEAGFEEAAERARQHPKLGIGLHLTLLCGHSALPAQSIPGLVNLSGEFSTSPVEVGFRYFFKKSLIKELRAEIHAQFEKFRTTGLRLDHLNGHLHLHLHPTVFKILIKDADQLGIERMRLTFDPFWLNCRLAKGHWCYRALHAFIYHVLAWRARSVLDRRGIRHTGTVFGLLQNGRVDESYVKGLLKVLPAGDSELYSHPSLVEFRKELDALTNPDIRAQIEQLGIELIRYQDL